MDRPFGRRGEFFGLTWGIVSLHVATFLLVQADQLRAWELFSYAPGAVGEGRWWTLFTYQFLAVRPMSLFFNVLSLYFLGLALEHEWGTTTYAVFWLCGVFGASGVAALFGFPMSGSVFLGVSFLVTYAFLWPDVEFLVFFVVPVKIKYLAMISAGVVLLDALKLGVRSGLVYAVGMFGGTVFYLVFLRPKTRIVRDAVVRVKEAGRVSSEAKLADRNRAFFERASALRPAGGIAEELPASPELDALRRDLRSAVVAEVRICKPVDYKGSSDEICGHCEGFAECTLRYLRGEPAEIPMAKTGD